MRANVIYNFVPGLDAVGFGLKSPIDLIGPLPGQEKLFKLNLNNVLSHATFVNHSIEGFH